MEPDFDGLMLRHLANRMLEEGRGETVLALGETAGGFLYVLGSRTEDMRQLSKELNGLLSGRGGGSQQMAQGTFFCRAGIGVCGVEELRVSSRERIGGRAGRAGAALIEPPGFSSLEPCN